MGIGSAILDLGKSPAEWCELFAAKGMHVSERSLRQKARELGACYVLGKTMIITPLQIDQILEGGLCRSNRTAEALSGGPGEPLTTKGSPSPATFGKALEHLQRAAQGRGSRRGPGKNVVVSFPASRKGR